MNRISEVNFSHTDEGLLKEYIFEKSKENYFLNFYIY